MPEQRLPLRPSEVGALQAEIRVSYMQEAHGHPGESRSAFVDATREEGEDRVRRVRQDVHQEGLVQEAYGGAHRVQAPLLPDMQQTVREEVTVAPTFAHPHGEEAVRLRYMRQGVHAEARPDLSQENASRPSSTVARNADRGHRERVHRRLRAGDKRARERGEDRGGGVEIDIVPFYPFIFLDSKPTLFDT